MASQVETVVVSCTGEDKTLRTLAGEYVEVGSNDGRKTYRKTHQIKVVDQYYDVFIYYWDDKEAEEWKGWWFGDQVGGLQVWSFQKSDAMKPPQEGWQVPFDGPVRSELNVLVNPKVEPTGVTKVPPPQPKASVQSSVRPAPQAKWESTKVEPEVVEVDDEMEDAKARAAALDARYKRRVAQATARVSNVEEHLKKALAALGELLPTDGQAVMQARKQLLVHQQKLTEVQKFVSAENLAAKTAPMMVRQGLESLIRKLRALQAEVKQALLGLPSPVKAETVPTPAYTPMEHEHLQQLEEMMPSVLEKIDQAEDEVEKVTIAAAPLQVESGEELRPVMLQLLKSARLLVKLQKHTPFPALSRPRARHRDTAAAVGRRDGMAGFDGERGSVWRAAKAQLYLSEAAQARCPDFSQGGWWAALGLEVKRLVGAERIHRNKDALRELSCFQEILGDLHAGQFGRAPERRQAAEEAQRRWERLKLEAQRHGVKAETICEVPANILSYVYRKLGSSDEKITA
ncbi:unnamed protein product [Durusdinium trenchii]|uniref:Uncharacterized protein n=1 Tax=Durusdinium trenchii TaxID=1381693 RepID=A0ABP0NIR5_9DINO